MKSPYLGEEEDNFLQKKKCWIIYCIACIVHVSHLKHKVQKKNVSRELKSYFHVSFNSSDNYAERLFKSMTTKDGRTYEAMMLGLIKV